MSRLMNIAKAAQQVKPNSTVMIGGFLVVGAPQRLLKAIAMQKSDRLTVIACAADYPDQGIGNLVSAGLIERAILSHIGTNPDMEGLVTAGKIELELVPQGTLVERIRAGGVGLGGVLISTGLGTAVEEGKRIIEANGRRYLLEEPLRADVALIKAAVGDHAGNLVYHGAARNINPLMALAADLVIAEVEELVPIGEIDPNRVMTPGIFVDIIVCDSEEG